MTAEHKRELDHLRSVISRQAIQLDQLEKDNDALVAYVEELGLIEDFDPEYEHQVDKQLEREQTLLDCKKGVSYLRLV